MNEKAIKKRIATLSEREKKALNEAVSTLYLDDSSDFGSSLFTIIKIFLGSDIYNNEEFDIYALKQILNPFAD